MAVGFNLIIRLVEVEARCGDHATQGGPTHLPDVILYSAVSAETDDPTPPFSRILAMRLITFLFFLTAGLVATVTATPPSTYEPPFRHLPPTAEVLDKWEIRRMEIRRQDVLLGKYRSMSAALVSFLVKVFGGGPSPISPSDQGEGMLSLIHSR